MWSWWKSKEQIKREKEEQLKKEREEKEGREREEKQRREREEQIKRKREAETRRQNVQILNTWAKRLTEETLDNVTILLIGPTGAGKSSFINNCLSAIDNIRFNTAPTGDNNCITKLAIPYYLDVKNTQTKVTLLDSQGYYLDVTTKIIDQTITGQRQIQHSIPEAANPVPDDENPVEIKLLDPKTATIIVFVFSQKWVTEFKINPEDKLDKDMQDQMEKMKRTRDNVRKAGIPAFVLMTRIDEVDSKIEEDILGYRSKELDEKTKYLKNLFDIANVIPVWNIPDSRPEIDVFHRCHILRILNQIIENALKSQKNCQRIREEMEKNRKK